MDKFQIEQIRYDLTWPIRHIAMYPHLPLEEVKLSNDPEGIHFGVYSGDQLSTVISVFHNGRDYQFRKFATLPEAQGNGYGTLLLKHIIGYVKEMSAERLWCNARVAVAPFYERFGFKMTNQRYVQHDIEFVIMELQLNNYLGA